MLANVLRSHSVYNHAGYILSYIKNIYKRRNVIIPVQVKDECSLPIKSVVCQEYCNVKEVLIFGFDNRRKINACLSNVAHSTYGEQGPDSAALN